MEYPTNEAQLRNFLEQRKISMEQLETVISELIPTDIQEEHYCSSESGIIDHELICEEYEIYLPADWSPKVQEAFLCIAYNYGPYGRKVAKAIHRIAGVCVDAEKMLFFFNVAKAMALVVAAQKAKHGITGCEEDAEDISELTRCREAVQLEKLLMQQEIMTSPFPQGDELIETMASLHVVRKQLCGEGVPMETW